MRTDVVVVVPPEGERGSRVSQAGEDLLVQEFIPQAAVEALDEGVLGRLAGLDIVPRDAAIALPAEHRPTGQLGAVVAHDGLGPAIEPDHGIKLPGDAMPRDRGIGDQRQTFPSVVVDNGKDAEPPRSACEELSARWRGFQSLFLATKV